MVVLRVLGGLGAVFAIAAVGGALLNLAFIVLAAIGFQFTPEGISAFDPDPVRERVANAELEGFFATITGAMWSMAVLTAAGLIGLIVAAPDRDLGNEHLAIAVVAAIAGAVAALFVALPVIPGGPIAQGALSLGLLGGSIAALGLLVSLATFRFSNARGSS